MWFLLFQIAFLLLLAALFGALLAYWWFKRRYEDVTESHALLIEQGNQLDLSPLDERIGLLQSQLSAPNPDIDAVKSELGIISARLTEDKGPDLEPIEARLARIESAVTSFKVPEPDLGPLHSGLAQLELSLQGLDMPETDLRPVEEAMLKLEKAQLEEAENITARLNHISATLEAMEAPDLSIEMLHIRERLAGIEASIYNMETPAIDTTALEERFDELHAYMTTPDYNIIELRDRLAGIEASIYNTDFQGEPVDLGPLQQRLEILQTSVTTSDPNISEIRDRLERIEQMLEAHASPTVDLTPVEQRLDMLHSQISAPNQDMDGLFQRLSSLEYAISAIDRQPVDINPLYSRLANMEAELGAIRTELHGTGQLDVIEQRLAGLHEALLSVQQPDFGPVLNSLHSIDMAGLENRMTAIEYGLAALHHTLRTRTETIADHQPAPPRRMPPPPPPLARPVPTPTPPPPRQVRRAVDPLSAARRPGDLANLLTRPAFGPADDLERISGVGPMLSDLLNDVGVYYFWQIAEWSPEDVEYVDDQLQHFRGRIERDDWVGQAKVFAAEPATANRPDSNGYPERY